MDISWKTAYEGKIRYFEVQRSKIVNDFTTIGTVKARNIQNGSNYLFTDDKPAAGYNYYRLRSVDLDGSMQYSQIVLVNFKKSPNLISSIYPNPSNGIVILKLEGSIKGSVHILILDNAGKRVASKSVGNQNTSQLITPIDLRKLSRGSYFLSIVVNGNTYHHQIVVQ